MSSSQTSYAQAQHLRTYPIPPRSKRVALILNRFSDNCNITYCSNDFFIQRDTAHGRPFFDYVAEEQEELVRKWMEMVKSWGVSDRGGPA